MARMPGARWVGPHHDNGRMSRFDIVCIHTIVGRAPAHAAHFSTDGAGNIYQSRDTAYRSAANLNGNHRIIAIENEDMGPHFPKWSTGDGHAVPAFTDAQLRSEEHTSELQSRENLVCRRLLEKKTIPPSTYLPTSA